MMASHVSELKMFIELRNIRILYYAGVMKVYDYLIYVHAILL